MEIGETLLVSSRQEWREWLAEHHRDYKEIWLIYYKKTSGKTGISYEESVEEALCFGWIDGQNKSIDQDTYAGRFTPRRPKSPWSDSNRERVTRLLRDGHMTEAGLAVLPADLRQDSSKGPNGLCRFQSGKVHWGSPHLKPEFRSCQP